MAEDLRDAAAEAALPAEQVAEQSFPTSFRGFDPHHVRRFLGRIAQQLEAAESRVAELEAELHEARAAAEAAPAVTVPATPDSDAALQAARTAALEIEAAAGAQAARLLDEARASARAIQEDAERDAASLRADAEEALAEARRESEALVARRREEAEAVAADIVAAGERQAATRIVEAREEAERIIEAAKEQGRELLLEAQAVITRRKRSAEAQLEQLREGRDRLLDTVQAARRALDELLTGVDSGRIAEQSARTEPSRPSRRADEPATPARGVPMIDAARAAVLRSESGSEEPPVESPPEPERRVVALGGDRGGAADANRGGEERRSSSLRILRRVRAEAPAPVGPPQQAQAPAPAPAEPSMVEVRQEVEGVRLLGPKPRPAGAEDAPGDEAPAGAETVPPAAREPEPEPDGEQETAPETVPEPEAAVVAPEPAPDVPPVEPEVVAESPVAEAEVVAAAEPPPPEPQPVAEVRPEPEPAPGGEPRPARARPAVDDLFARIRADREAAVGHARQVLADPGSEAEAEVRGGVAVETAPVRDAAEPAVSDADESLLQQRDAALEGLEVQLTRRLKRALQDEQNTTLDALRTSKGARGGDRLLPAPDVQAARYVELARPALAEAARLGATGADTPVEDLAAQLAADVVEPLRQRIAAALHDGEDADAMALGERIGAVYREWKTQRVERVASHYLIAAHARGRFLAVPDGAALVWVVDDGGTPCPDCDDNTLAGPTPRGEAFPTGQVHPPAHVGCRCLLKVVPA